MQLHEETEPNPIRCRVKWGDAQLFVYNRNARFVSTTWTGMKKFKQWIKEG